MRERGVQSRRVRPGSVGPASRSGPPAPTGATSGRRSRSSRSSPPRPAGRPSRSSPCGPARAPSAQASPSDVVDASASDDVSSEPPVADTHDAVEMEALLPTLVSGSTLQTQSWTGDTILGDDTFSTAMNKFLTDSARPRRTCASPRRTTRPRPSTSPSTAYRVAGVKGTAIRDALIAAWKVDYPALKVTTVTLGGKEVTKADFGQDAIAELPLPPGRRRVRHRDRRRDPRDGRLRRAAEARSEPAGRGVRQAVVVPRPVATAPPAPIAELTGVSGPAETYTHGHHESVLRSHRWRTAANSAAYLLPHLRAGQDLLDVGCGPGTITIDLARIVAPGRVVGVDRAEAPLATARADAATAGVAVDFEVGDAYALAFPDDSFDVVHAHQLLQHLGRPVAALAEMRRVCRPDGIVAARDSDYAAMTWFPGDPLLDRWLSIYREVARANGGEPDAGRRLLAWGRAAGFAEVVAVGIGVVLRDRQRTAPGGAACGQTGSRRRPLRKGRSSAASAIAAELGRIADAWRSMGGRAGRLVQRAPRRDRLPRLTAGTTSVATTRPGSPAGSSRGWTRRGRSSLGGSRLVARARRARRGAGRHVGSLLLGPAGAGDGDRLGERLGGGGRQAAHPGRLDLLDALGLGLRRSRSNLECLATIRPFGAPTRGASEECTRGRPRDQPDGPSPILRR